MQKLTLNRSFFKLMNNTVFGKTMENLAKHRDTKLVRNKTRCNYLVSEPNYHTIDFFSENLLVIETREKHKYS